MLVPKEAFAVCSASDLPVLPVSKLASLVVLVAEALGRTAENSLHEMAR